MIELRIRYHRAADVRDDVKQQLDRGGIMVRVAATDEMQLGTRVRLTLVLPDGTPVACDGEVLNLLGAHGVAIGTPPTLAAEVRRHAGWQTGDAPDAGAAEHEIVAPSPGPLPANASIPPAEVVAMVDETEDAGGDEPMRSSLEALRADELTRAEKIHLALHGTRDERNAILRDRNKALHSFVLKNPQLNADDVAQIARNPQVGVDLLKQIAERKEWFQRGTIALALARNPRTPPDVAVRALEYVPIESLRQMAKGIGALPHVVQAARKKVLAR